ncbi:hypothetical protein [Luedemannella flava]|uniref:hypothetical protein n=1 Tax=Luedemannella flava TaxID=349316 RepID=UPI0031CE9892
MDRFLRRLALVLLVVVPLAGCGGSGGPVAVWATAGPTASATAGATVVPTTAAPGPDASFTLATLGEQKLMPLDWGVDECPTAELRFRKGKATFGGYTVTIRQAIATDVDGDGRRETVALFACRAKGSCAVTSQVSVVDREASGKVVVRLQVVSMEYKLQAIPQIRVPRAGVVDARVAEYDACEPSGVQRFQWRSYAFVSAGFPYKAFNQSAGPTEFPPNPLAIDLGISLTEGKGGAMKATIRNASTFTATRIWVAVFVRDARTISAGSGLHSCTGGPALDNPRHYVLWCRTSDIKAGKSLTVSLKASLRSGDGDTIITVGRHPAGPVPWSTKARSYPDPVSGNNSNLGFG